MDGEDNNSGTGCWLVELAHLAAVSDPKGAGCAGRGNKKINKYINRNIK